MMANDYILNKKFDMGKFGRILRNTREEKHISVTEMGRILDIPVSTLYRYEEGGSLSMPVPYILLILKYLGLSTSDLEQCWEEL